MAKSSPALKPIAVIGDLVLDVIANFGRFCMFAAGSLAYAPLEISTARGWRRLMPQCFAIGTQSVPVIMLTGMFVGMVLVVQGYDQFAAAGFEDRLGGVVNVSVVAELGPVLAGVMLAGRVGGALTAELGTMNVTEQLLALRSMGCDPMRYLVAPRFLACLFLAPLLTAYANFMGALGSWLIFVGVYQGASEPFWSYSSEIIERWDIGVGLLKSMFFGSAIGLVGCYKGFHCRGGAEGVGQACTQAFVASFIIILALDFFLNIVLNGIYNVLFGYRILLS